MYKTLGLIAVIGLLFSGCAKPQSKYIYTYNNLLKNAGFEKVSNGNFDNWITDGATIRNNDPKPYKGKNYLMGSMNNKSITHTYQVINLLTNGYTAKDLDSGNMLIKYGGYQSGWKTQRDSGTIEVVCQDENHKEIVYDKTKGFYSNRKWVRRYSLFWIPKGTRYIKYIFIAKRVDGEDIDAYFDEAFLYTARKR
jgi:hypothetical protein